MTLLCDEEILDRMKGSRPVILDLPAPADWFSKDSPVQSSSVDLHIGEIFLPSPDEEMRPRQLPKAMNQIILEPGRTAVVTTLETLDLPSDLAAFGFPPSRVSFRGILMTNPGHVDPGYKGSMRFTLINMGRENYVLRRGDVVVTLLLLQMQKPAKSDWGCRRPSQYQVPKPSREEIDRLTYQFLDVDRRAEKAAKKYVDQAEFRVKILSPLLAALVGALVTGLLTLGQQLVSNKPLEEIKESIAKLEQQLSVKDLERRIETLEKTGK